VRFSRTGLFSNTRFRKSAEGLEGCLSRLGSSYDPWSGHFDVLSHCRAALPRRTVALAASIAPLQEHPHGLVAALLQAGGVPVDSVVIVIPTTFRVEPRAEFWQPVGPVLLAPRGAALQGAPEFLAGRPPLEVIFPLAVLAPPKLESQKLEAHFSYLSVPTALVPCDCKAPYVLDLSNGLDQEYLIERETMLQNS
jgi:hypothetical protein